MKYADRTDEYNTISKMIESGTRAIFVETNEAVGITSFLNAKFENYRMIYVDCNDAVPVLFAIINQLSSEERTKLQKTLNKKYGHREKRWLASIFSIIPYIGNFISDGVSSLIEGKKTFSIGDIDTEKALQSVIPEFIENNSGKSPICIAFDNAQAINAKEADEIMYLAENTTAIFIFVITSQKNEIYKIRSNFLSKKITCDDIYFPSPSIELVMELSQYQGKELSCEEARNIISFCSGNIYKIRECVETGNFDNDFNYSVIESGIISVCDIYHTVIKKKRLFEILCSYRELILDYTSFQNSIDKLSAYGIIDDSEANIKMIGANHPIAIEVRNNNIDHLIYQKIVYEYLSKNNPSNLHELELLYCLSLEYESQRSCEWLETLILNIMENQLSIDRNLLERLSLYDVSLLRIIAYTYVREYSKALKDLDEFKKDHLLSSDIQRLYAVLLNRCRKHKKAEKLLTHCLAEVDNNIIAAFLISNYVHQEKIKEAEDFIKDYVKHAPSENIGYVYRNGAAIKFGDLNYFEMALEAFNNAEDDYGYNTTLCNYAIRRALTIDDYQCEKDLLRVKDYLECFNHSDLHIIYNNLGLYYILHKREKEAAKYLKIAELKSGTSMPSIFSRINQAALMLKQGFVKESKEYFDSITISVPDAQIERVKQKYYINKLLIYYANAQKLEKHIENASLHLDRYDPNYTKRILEFYRQRINMKEDYRSSDFDKLFCPCYLEYWYVNPLKLVDGNLNKVLTIHT